ncbi:hypothetical protein C8R44DRAFT_886646 [Mycena epipterygia]|nr:hypothetical protein C8R44DRAFT_886646 [Mycena epipterygia]
MGVLASPRRLLGFMTIRACPCHRVAAHPWLSDKHPRRELLLATLVHTNTCRHDWKSMARPASGTPPPVSLEHPPIIRTAAPLTASVDLASPANMTLLGAAKVGGKESYAGKGTRRISIGAAISSTSPTLSLPSFATPREYPQTSPAFDIPLLAGGSDFLRLPCIVDPAAARPLHDGYKDSQMVRPASNRSFTATLPLAIALIVLCLLLHRRAALLLIAAPELGIRD